MVQQGMMSLVFTSILLSGTLAFTPSKFAGCKRLSPTSLDYLNGDDDVVAQEFYTDKLWATALRPHTKREVDQHANDEKTPLELRPISVSLKKSKAPNEDLIETAKAFTLVAIEVGVVAAAAANDMY